MNKQVTVVGIALIAIFSMSCWECGVRNAECGMRNAQLPTPHSQLRTPNAKLFAKTPNLKELLERLRKVERELDRLKAKQAQIPAEKEDQKILALLETPLLGSTYYGSSGIRLFAAKLIFVNLTPQTVTVSREQIQLEADGKTYKLTDIPTKLRHQSIRMGNQRVRLETMNPAKQVRLPVGGTASTWVTFTQLPRGSHIPKLSLKITLTDKQIELNVNQFAERLLGLTVERIGPRGSLGLLTISGSFNTINMGSLVEALDRLTAQKVARAVICWTKSAAPLEPQLASWLLQAAQQAGLAEVTNSRFPTIPVAIRELHLAQMPSQSGSSRYRTSSSSRRPARIHKTTSEAVSAALKSAYQVLPRDELLKEIEHGHPLTRAAALANGGGRLSSEHLPVVLKYADDNNTAMQRAALVALGHFGEQQAIDKLLVYARNNAEPTASVAIESLAGSRYANAHAALLDILKNEPPASKKKIVGVLARHPRPVWSETIYEFVQDFDSEIVVEALRALVQVGHPKLGDVLERALGQQGNAALQNEAFRILAVRTDARSEELAISYTLSHLKTSPMTNEMYQLLFRTKDHRAVPLLLEQLNRSQSNRTQVINALANVGDQDVAQILVKSYPSLNLYEKRTVLTALQQLRSPEFRRLAGQALLTSDSTLVNVACRGLQAEGSPEAVALLIKGLEESSRTSTWSYISNALGTLGTPEARNALRKARGSGNTNKQRYADSALQNIRRRSPGYQYVVQAQSSAKQENWKEALDQFNMALKIDSQLPEAHAGRATVLLRQNKVKQAHADFAKALELDPYNGVAVTGMGTALVLEGEYEAGIKYVEDARSKFSRDMLFAYNTACVYGRALERVVNNKQIADRGRKIQTYRQKALAELKRCVKLGFSDYDWMKKDPDLKLLHDVPEFQQIHTSKGTGK